MFQWPLVSRKCTAHLTGAPCQVGLATGKGRRAVGGSCAVLHSVKPWTATLFVLSRSTGHTKCPTVFQLHFATTKVIQENLVAQDVIRNLNIFYKKPKIIKHINMLPQPR